MEAKKWLGAAIIPLVAGAALGQATPSDCWNAFVQHQADCEFDFHSSDNPNYQNQSAYESCLNGANAGLDACLDGANQNAISQAWYDFRQRIKDCISTHVDDDAGLASCLEGAFAVYQAELEDILNPDDDECGPAANGIEQMSPVYTLVQGAIAAGRTDGKYPAIVSSTVSFTAGVNPGGGTAYDVQQEPCLKNAVSIAIYATKNGTKSIVYDGDTDTSDGVSFSLPLFQSELIDAEDVHIVNVYYDHNAMPRFAEHGVIAIEDSPLSGDWNRDNVADPQDMIDYLSSYGAQTNRADLNDDESVDQDDAAEFIQNYND